MAPCAQRVVQNRNDYSVRVFGKSGTLRHDRLGSATTTEPEAQELAIGRKICKNIVTRSFYSKKEFVLFDWDQQ